MKTHSRTATRHARNLAISPADPVIPSGAERLHRCFFCGEAAGIALSAICFGVAVSNLRLGINALQKAGPKTFNRLSDAIDLGDIDSHSDNHALNLTASDLL